jgi:hypothetical protein
MSKALAALLALLILSQPASAAPERRVALIVANAAYGGTPLGNPVVDARAIEPALKAAGFDVTMALDADLSRFDAAIEAFAARARGADIALFYFAGHGFAINDGLIPRNYLMSTNALLASPSERMLKAGGIPLDEIVQRLSGSAKTTLVFVDACRNDPRAKRGVGGARGLARLETGGIANLFVAVSTRLGDEALDGAAGAGSPFGRAFAKEIATAGVRIDDAFARMRQAVSAETAQQQRPEIIQDDLDAPLVLVGLPVAPEPVAKEPPATTRPEPASLPDVVAPRTAARGLTYESISADPYSGMDHGDFVGAWITFYAPRIDGSVARPAVSFEITGTFPRNQPESIAYTIGLSDMRTVHAFDTALAMKADLGHRFFIDHQVIRSGRWRKVFRSMEPSDQRIMAGICRTLSEPEATNAIVQSAADASKGPFVSATMRDFWVTTSHRKGIAALGKACFDSIRDKSVSDDVFVSAAR